MASNDSIILLIAKNGIKRPRMTVVPKGIKKLLKIHSCKLYNNKYAIVATPITNIEIFAFIAVLVFKLLIRKVLFLNKRGNRNY